MDGFILTVVKNTYTTHVLFFYVLHAIMNKSAAMLHILASLD